MPTVNRTKIEAKFSVPDDSTFEKLLALEAERNIVLRLRP